MHSRRLTPGGLPSFFLRFSKIRRAMSNRESESSFALRRTRRLCVTVKKLPGGRGAVSASANSLQPEGFGLSDWPEA